MFILILCKIYSKIPLSFDEQSLPEYPLLHSHRYPSLPVGKHLPLLHFTSVQTGMHSVLLKLNLKFPTVFKTSFLVPSLQTHLFLMQTSFSPQLLQTSSTVVGDLEKKFKFY